MIKLIYSSGLVECKHVPVQTLPFGKFRAVQLASRFNWPRSPLSPVSLRVWHSIAYTHNLLGSKNGIHTMDLLHSYDSLVLNHPRNPQKLANKLVEPVTKLLLAQLVWQQTIRGRPLDIQEGLRRILK